MSNSLDASIKEVWSMDYQESFDKSNIFESIANFRYESDLKTGDTLNRPYISEVSVNTLGAEGSYTRQDINTTNETLTVDQEKEATFYLKDIDAFQSHYPTRERFAKQCGIKLANRIDGDVLGEVVNADSTLDDSIFGGTAGNGINLTTSNVLRVFSIANRKLRELDNDPSERKFATLSPYFEQVLIDSLGGREDALGERTGINGHIGRYGGFELFSTNASYWTGTLAIATNPSDGDTVVINGVTFTFKSTLGTTAGNVHIASTAAKTVASLVAAINTPGTTVASDTDAGFVALSSADQKKLQDVTATDATTSLTLVSEGHGHLAVSETLTDDDDVWTDGKEMEHLIFGQGRPSDIIVQKYPNMMTKDRSGYIGQDIVNYIVYGLKTFDDGDKKMVDVQIDTQSL